MTDKTLVERLLSASDGKYKGSVPLLLGEAIDRINTLELEALGADIKIDALERMPLAVLVGHGHLVASVGEFLAKHCVLVKEPADDRLVLAIFGANDAHLSRIADALNDAPPPDSDKIRSYVFNALDALESGLDRGTVQDNLVQELLRVTSAQPAEAVGEDEAFKAAMVGKQYGREETRDARAWFSNGFRARIAHDAAQGAVATCRACLRSIEKCDGPLCPGRVRERILGNLPDSGTPDTTAAELLGLVDWLKKTDWSLRAPQEVADIAAAELRTLAGKIKESGT